MLAARRVDLTRPSTWEFSGFSQNGEDGILQVLRSQLLSENRYFIEIGSADGIENNTAWLLIAEKYSGVMIEGNGLLAARAMTSVVPYSVGSECLHMFATRENASQVLASVAYMDPDVFSIDIDGCDYYVVEALLATGMRPKIMVVEYNSVFGPERSITVEYRPDFSYLQADPTNLYYGVSLAAWRRYLSSKGYRFITVERNGVNAFFVDPSAFNASFLESIHGLEYAENVYQNRRFRQSTERQFNRIENKRYFTVS
jgi:hypothetical protein